jgi:hypothetical protein
VLLVGMNPLQISQKIPVIFPRLILKCLERLLHPPVWRKLFSKGWTSTRMTWQRPTLRATNPGFDVLDGYVNNTKRQSICKREVILFEPKEFKIFRIGDRKMNIFCVKKGHSNFSYVRTFHRLHLLRLWTPTI